MKIDKKESLFFFGKNRACALARGEICGVEERGHEPHS